MLLDFPCLQYDTAPFKTLRKKVSQSRISLITSAGLHLRTDKPFQRGDQTYRVLPSSTSKNEIIQSHISIGFDHTPFYRDINVVYPVDRIRELLHRGVVGSISENYYSFMGATADPREMIEKTGPEVAQRLLNESVDVVLLTPI